MIKKKKLLLFWFMCPVHKFSTAVINRLALAAGDLYRNHSDLKINK